MISEENSNNTLNTNTFNLERNTNKERDATDDSEVKRLLDLLDAYQKELEMQQKELEENRKRFDNKNSQFEYLYSHAPVGFLIINHNGYIVKVNSKASEVLERGITDLEDTYIFRFVDDDNLPTMKKILNAIFRLEGVSSELKFELNCIITPHSRKLISFVAKPFDDGISEKKAALLSMYDLSTHKENEMRITLARDYYKTILNYFPSLVWISDQHGQFNYFNITFQNYTGLEPKDLAHNHWLTLVHPTDAMRVREELRHLFATKQHGRFEFRLMGKDKTYRWFLNECKPFYGIYDDFQGFIGTCVDQTDIKEAEQLLLESQQKYKALVENIPAASYLASMDGSQTLFYMSPQINQILGYKADILRPKNDFWQALTHPLELPALLHGIEESRKNMLPFEMEHRMLNTSGTYTWVYNKAVVIASDDQSPKYLQGVIMDISQRKEFEEKINLYTQMLIELNSQKDKFISFVSHDLKNPFNQILGFTDLLIQDYSRCDDDKRLDMIQNIHSSANKAYSLLEDLLQWSRIQLKTLKTNKTSFNIAELIIETKTELDTVFVEKNIAFHFDDPIAAYVLADITMIRSVIRNLLNNALKFTPPYGKIHVQMQVTDLNCSISIADTGIGIAANTIGKLFRIDTARSTAGTQGEQGTGMGLILCKDFLERNNGTIRVESVLEKGSNFIFTLPLASVQP